ncbi:MULTISPECIES: hypothetical protein [Streptomyces]|uniref:hypothetical protein n=1 Tax=Streptomyces TaxID=1883 RepID=UPI001F2AE3AE|nr:hypothetical protein [Streptomyces sp. A1-5]UJB46115.1 hypothetical protein HRD51_40025 [Streptomyces sp. A1-5]
MGTFEAGQHQAVGAARAQVLVMQRSGPFADAGSWASWRWESAWSPRSCRPVAQPSDGHGRQPGYVSRLIHSLPPSG